MSVKLMTYEEVMQLELTENEKYLSNNGSGKECASYIVIADRKGRRIYSDAMEPEDARFDRDLSWIVEELNLLNEPK